MSNLLAPPSKADARRFAYCLVLASALHAAGGISRLWHPRRPRPVQVEPKRTIVPVSIDDEPGPAKPPAPSPPPPPPEPPAPAPARPPVAPPDGELPRAQPHEPPAAAPAPAPSAAKPRAQHEPRKRAEDASAFGGSDGAFRALVCLVPRNVRSALMVDGCKPVASFRTNAIDVAPRRFTHGFPGVERRVDWFGIDYRGRFKVRATDYYTFRLLSDDGAIFYIDGQPVIDNDGQHSPRSEKMALPLTKGEHEFRLLYFQGPGETLALELFVKRYKTEERPFGPVL